MTSDDLFLLFFLLYFFLYVKLIFLKNIKFKQQKKKSSEKKVIRGRMTSVDLLIINYFFYIKIVNL